MGLHYNHIKLSDQVLHRYNFKVSMYITVKNNGHKGIMYIYLEKCPKILNLEHCRSEGRCSRNGK